MRQLKSSGVEKSVWQPEVAILLDLKKKLEMAQKNALKSSTQASPDNIVGGAAENQNLEEEVSKQV